MEVDSHSLIIITASTYVPLSCVRCVSCCSIMQLWWSLRGIGEESVQSTVPERETGGALEREGGVMFRWQPH